MLEFKQNKQLTMNEKTIRKYEEMIVKNEKLHRSVIDFFLVLIVFTFIYFLNGLIKIMLFSSIIKSQRRNFW